MARFFFIALAIFLSSHASRATADDILTIGNSLTADALVLSLEGRVFHSFYCGQNLQFAHDNPDSNCSGLPWDSLITQREYDWVTVQPFTGTTLQQDIDVISTLMELQPNANFVLHAGWTPEATFLDDFSAGNPDDTYRPSPEYLADLLAALQEIDPDRTFTQTRTNELLFNISQDIENGIGPFDELSDLYRDPIHFNDTGRYLAHNALRTALGQPLAERADLDPIETAYLDSQIVALTAVPEPSSLFGLVACVLLFSSRRSRQEI